MSAGYSLVTALPGDWQRLASFLRKAFYPHEPLTVAVGMAHCPSDVDVSSTLRQLPEQSSLIALDTATGEILGCCICGEIRPNEEADIETEAASCSCPGFQKILRILAAMERRGGHYWQHWGASKALAVYALAVDPAARRRGVARALLERVRSLAKTRGYPLLHVDCSSVYSSKLMEQMGMECVYSLKYEDFKDVNEEPIFTPPLPHTEMRKYILKI